MISPKDSGSDQSADAVASPETSAAPSTTAAAPRASGQQAGFPVFLLVQLVLTAAVFGYGTHRYQKMEEQRLPPAPATEPVRIAPVRDVPAVASDDQLVSVLTRLRPQFRGPQPKINYIDHALRFWGLEATFADEDSLSGVELRELLTDHRRFRDAWGEKTRPFLLPDTSGDVSYLAFRTRSGQATASHYDHTLAGLAEVGTPLDYPVNTPDGEMPLQAAFNFTRDMFSLNQGEYEWSVLVFLHYMPHIDSWFTSEGQQVTWDLLAERLMRQRLARGVCYGNHRLYTLAAMLQVDEEFDLLTPEARDEVIAYLRDVSARLTETQHEEGHWDGRWPGEEWDGPQPERVEGPLGIKGDRLLATGHTLEWWAIAPDSVLPAEDVVTDASQWLIDEIESLSDAEIRQYYTFLTHAGRALCLWRGRLPAEVWSDSRDTPESLRQASESNAPASDSGLPEDPN